MHRDRIGSVVAISDANGSLPDKLAYDSWGKRRALTGNAPPDSIDVTDNKGFTGHEILDQLDLVHMNEGIYDPLVARFMSADPIIQDPEHSQSYNRYTYVWNNPTNLTDPTGFIADSAPTNAKTGCDEECQRRKKREEEERKRFCPYCWLVGSGGGSSDAKSGQIASAENQVAGASANSGGFWSRVSDFLGQANRSFGLFDNFVPSRESFEGGAQQLLGGPCEYNCAGHDAAVRSTADVMQGAAQGVAEAGNRYYPELAKTAVLAAMPIGAAVKTAEGLGLTRSQLQHAFKHAKDFGISGNANNATLAEFGSVLQSHINSAGTRVINGTYRGNPVTHFVDPNTRLNVIRDPSGNFLSGWQLSQQQLRHVLTTGKLGGG